MPANHFQAFEKYRRTKAYQISQIQHTATLSAYRSVPRRSHQARTIRVPRLAASRHWLWRRALLFPRMPCTSLTVPHGFWANLGTYDPPPSPATRSAVALHVYPRRVGNSRLIERRGYGWQSMTCAPRHLHCRGHTRDQAIHSLESMLFRCEPPRMPVGHELPADRSLVVGYGVVTTLCGI